MSISLVIGASGLVGNHLQQTLMTQGETVVGTCFDKSLDDFEWLDIRNEQAVEHLIQRLRPNVIYIPAAMTNVDYCELHPEESFAVNVLGIRNVVQAAQAIKALVVFFSSDYIFNGLQGPYDETDAPNPLSVYGQHKVLAELLVSQWASRFLIIRTTVVYGKEYEGKNFIYRLWQTLRKQQTLRVPVDQIGNPTYAPNMAQIVSELVNNESTGVFNVVGPVTVNRYVFAQEAAQIFGLNEALILPITTRELDQPARRPLRAGLKTNKVEAEVATPLMDYREGLQLLAKELVQWSAPI